VFNFGIIRSRNLQVYDNNSTAIWQKSAYHAKYLRISQTYLHLLYRFGRRISGDDYPNIRLAVAQGRCYGNQLNLGDVRKRRVQ